MNIKRIIFISVLVVIVSIYIYLGNAYTKRQGRIFYATFDSSSLNGKLDRVFIAHKGTAIKLVNDSNTFVFDPVTSTLNNNQIFNSFAEKGDKVIKPPYSDTLKLVKGNKVYLYTFQKFND